MTGGGESIVGLAERRGVALCECGCGEMTSGIGKDGRQRRFCMGHSHTSPKTVFEHNVRFGAADECWPWTGRIDPEGYGKMGPLGRAHRIAWERANGPIPAGLWVLHRCDNPPCCNPAHLWLGTAADNSADMAAKGRSGPTRHGAKRKLNLEVAREIRARYAAGGITYPELALAYGVHRAHVVRVVSGRSWPEPQGGLSNVA